MPKPLNLINQTFGELTVINKADKKNGRVAWHCRCSCGNEVNVITNHLTSGHTRSCGCLQKKITSQLNPRINISGQKFGKLLVLKEAPSRNKKTYWLCQCDCGNLCEVKTESLKSNHTTSCGCISSKGEENIANWLIANKIPFIRQKTFETCRNPKTNYLLRFDFFIMDKILIEYDGINHYKPTNGWNYEGAVQETQERDKIKDNWAKDNNIPLYRISYNENYTENKLNEIMTSIIKGENNYD